MKYSASTTTNRVSDGLLRIEMELRQLGYWEQERPSDQALGSQQPFCIDTLAFNQWLQFIFLPRMKVLVEQEQDLPRVSGVAPMAEEFFRREPVTGEALISVLSEMDSILSQQ